MWVFDDPAVDLVREPFVGGTDTMIDLATTAFTLLLLTFSAKITDGKPAVRAGQRRSRPPRRGLIHDEQDG
jgi:hypothetical protein